MIWFNFCSNLVSLADGCPRTGATINTINPSRFARGGVRCCSKDGQKCDSLCKNKRRRGDRVTYEVALQRCASKGWRLCTADELASNKCCATGCQYDIMSVWQTGGVSKSGNNNQGINHKNFALVQGNK